jgi:DNA-binding NarL/FixJ family response regulator
VIARAAGDGLISDPDAFVAGAAGPPALGGHDTRELAALQRRLHSAESLGELLRLACDHAAEWCGFQRALILTVEDDLLSASLLGALHDTSSDVLRRRALADPVMIRAESMEAELIRGFEMGRAPRGHAVSQLQAQLGLTDFVLGAVMPEERVLALVVVDRQGPPVQERDRETVQFFSQLLALSVERVFLRSRMRELAVELRHLTASAQAVMREALESPVAMPTDYGNGPVFATQMFAPTYSGTSATSPSADRLREILTAREQQIAGLMVAGRSNREIAGELHLSPETIKGYVARVLRKLGAANRVDAVSRYMRLASGDE